MGKVRRKRQKYHLAAVSNSKDDSKPEAMDDDSITPEQLQNIRLLDMPGGLFKEVDIDVSKLGKHFDSQSMISKKSIKEMDKKLSKKEKIKLRHNLWLKKIDITKKAKVTAKEIERKDKKMKQSVVGSIQPLLDALPTIPVAESKPIVVRKIKEDSRMRRKFKQRQKDTMKDIGTFRHVLNHPSFKKNPESTISCHIMNVLRNESNRNS